MLKWTVFHSILQFGINYIKNIQIYLKLDGCDLGSLAENIQHIVNTLNDISNSYPTSQLLYLWPLGHCFQYS